MRECDGNEGQCTQFLLDLNRRQLILSLMEAFPEKGNFFLTLTAMN